LLGAIQTAQNRFPESLRAHRRRCGSTRPGRRRTCGIQDIRLDVSVDLRDIAYCLRQTGRLAEAAANYRKALGISEAVAAADANDVSRRQWVALISLQLGQALVEMDQSRDGSRS